MIILTITLAISATLFFIFYNSVIGKKNEVENAMGGLDAQLKQRFDLIPNLISSVKVYMKHEVDVLKSIVELRGQAFKGSASHSDKEKINQEISHALSGIMVQVEQYPELKASEQFVSLQNKLTEIEDHIAASRRFYNTAVTNYNNSLEMVPTKFIASMLGYQRKEVFHIPEFERQNVNVENLFKKASQSFIIYW